MTEAPKAEEQFSNSNSAPETPVEEKKAHSINGNDPGNTPDPNSNSGSVPTTELDEKALFRRLSPSSRQALNEADGIRMALGAQTMDVVRLVMAQGMKPVVFGLVVGLAAALALGRLIASQLYQTSAHNPLLLLTTAAILALAAVFACLLPARRASLLNPVEALRTE